MIRVINNQKILQLPENWEEKVASFLKDVLKEEGKKPFKELTVVVVDNSYITKLNKHFLGRESPTDVLAFPMEPESEIYVSAEIAMERAPDDPEKELVLYILHGLLHLLGYNHKEEAQEKLMRQKEQHYLEKWMR